MTSFDTFLKALQYADNYDGVLGSESVEFPPSENVDYWATPQNAVVFGWMGVDGVHYAILKIAGSIRESSPVLQIAPMDFDEPYSLLAPTFKEYLAWGCGVTVDKIQELLDREAAGSPTLLAFMRSSFQQSRFWVDGIEHDIGSYDSMIIRKPEGEQ